MKPTEDISLVGNDRFWNGFNDTVVINTTPTIWTADVTSEFDGIDSPKSGVVTRVDVDLAASAIPEEAASQQDSQTLLVLVVVFTSKY